MGEVLLMAISALSLVVGVQSDCSKNGYDLCVRIANPLVREAHLVFPDNLNDIDLVCGTWNKFVDCLKTFTDDCFTDQQRRQFNSAVEKPIESVHQMCKQPSYRKEYLHYAPCIKNIVIQEMHCGTQYKLLVDQVDQGEIISKSTLCCSYDIFKQCVLKETRKLCDRGMTNGPASRFASQIIGKALKFIEEQCSNYVPNSGDCSLYHDTALFSTDRSQPKFIVSDVQDSFVVQKTSAVSGSLSTSSWISSSRPTKSSADTTGRELLGSRSRPGNYGRSNSWKTEGSSTTFLPTTPSFPGLSSSQTHITRTSSTQYYSSPEFVEEDHSSPYTSTTTKYDSPLWSSKASHVTETWYPAAGNQIINEVDEPNQLGLSKTRNKGHTLTAPVLLTLLCASKEILFRN